MGNDKVAQDEVERRQPKPVGGHDQPDPAPTGSARARTRALRGRLSRPFRLANLTAKRVLATLTLVMTLVAIYHFYDPLFSGQPPKQPMTGDINVAVAGFVAAAGTNPADAADLSDSLYRSIRESLPSNLGHGERLDIQVDGPAKVGQIGAGARGLRTARDVAGQLRADVVIYGVVRDLAQGVQVTPEFYFAPRDDSHPEDQQPLLGAVSVPPEPSGVTSLAVITDLAADPALARADVRHRIELRSRAFADFVVGLKYYHDAIADQRRGSTGEDDFTHAQRWFESARTTRAWDPRVADVLYVFLGNVALELRDWAPAAKQYAAALQVEPRYDRAAFGLAEARFHQAAGQCAARGGSPNQLAQARNAYERALLLVGASDPVLRSKAQFGLGRTELCLGLAGAPAQYLLAERQFGAVATDYSRGDRAIATEAAEADGGLGLIVLLRGDRDQRDLDKAAASLKQSIALTPSYPVKSVLYGFLGQIERRRGDRSAATADARRSRADDTTGKVTT